MWQRVFIAINLPENVKKRLSLFIESHSNLPVRWTAKDNLHITLAFLGNIKDEEVVEVCKIVKDIAQKTEPFLIKLSSISYAPDNKIPPRMIWAKGEKSEGFSKLRKELEGSLSSFSYDEKIFSPHITLARVRQMEWRQIDLEEREDIKEELNVSFEVRSIEVMESKLKRFGPLYNIIDSFELKA